MRNFIGRLFKYFRRRKISDEDSSAKIPDEVREKFRRYKRAKDNLDAMVDEDLTSPEALRAGFMHALRASPEAAEKWHESLRIVQQAAEREKAGGEEPTDPVSKAREDEAFQFVAKMVVAARAER